MRTTVLAWVVLLPALGLAQPKPPAPPGTETFKMIEAYIVSNVQESLSLTDDQFVKVLPVLKRFELTRREEAMKRQAVRREIRQALNSGAATETRIAELMKELKGIEVEEPAALKRDRDALDAALTPLQQAKFRILEADVEQRIRGLMARVNQPRNAKPPQGAEEQP